MNMIDSHYGLGTYRTHLSNLDLENRNVPNTKKLIVVSELVYITVFYFLFLVEDILSITIC